MSVPKESNNHYWTKSAAISSEIAKIMGVRSGKAATKLVNRLAQGPLRNFDSSMVRSSARELGIGLDRPEIARAVERHLAGHQASFLLSRKAGSGGSGMMSNFLGQDKVLLGQGLKRGRI
jgi:hypothetical protein